MEITIKSFEPQENMSAYIRDQEAKHLCKGFKAVTFDGEKMVELVDLRIGATASTAYACVWFNGEKSGLTVPAGRADMDMTREAPPLKAPSMRLV